MSRPAAGAEPIARLSNVVGDDTKRPIAKSRRRMTPIHLALGPPDEARADAQLSDRDGLVTPSIGARWPNGKAACVDGVATRDGSRAAGSRLLGLREADGANLAAGRAQGAQVNGQSGADCDPTTARVSGCGHNFPNHTWTYDFVEAFRYHDHVSSH
jgi:hypothetical protein